ncbi:MAG: hypothetical protein ACJ78X_21150, partial [Myxococcales bacterium]
MIAATKRWSKKRGGRIPLGERASAPSLDAAQGRVFWNQSPSPMDGFPGCVATANADGSGGRCIDRGIYA